MPERVPMQARAPRAELPFRVGAVSDDRVGMTHQQLLDALRSVDGLIDVGRDPPNFHFRSRPFLHFHMRGERMYADVRFGNGDFEPIWASTPLEREELLARVSDHVERLQSLKKAGRGRSDRDRDG
jgi:hypothetical protein